jgi:hypothetical protein
MLLKWIDLAHNVTIKTLKFAFICLLPLFQNLSLFCLLYYNASTYRRVLAGIVSVLLLKGLLGVSLCLLVRWTMDLSWLAQAGKHKESMGTSHFQNYSFCLYNFTSHRYTVVSCWFILGRRVIFHVSSLLVCIESNVSTSVVHQNSSEIVSCLRMLLTRCGPFH